MATNKPLSDQLPPSFPNIHYNAYKPLLLPPLILKIHLEIPLRRPQLQATMLQIQLFSIIAFSALCVSAAPSRLQARDDPDSMIGMYSDNNCDNLVDEPVWGGPGTYSCFPVPQAVNSITVWGAGCLTTTWSGTNCRGSSYNIPDSNCHSLPYGSVSVQC